MATNPQQRRRETTRSAEGRQFSTVGKVSRLPEVRAKPNKMDFGQGDSGAKTEEAGATASFDPIRDDPVFAVVQYSKFWPPPPLSSLVSASAGTAVDAAGVGEMDMYDRRADDVKAKAETLKNIRGEVNHPRGKARQNTKVALD